MGEKAKGWREGSDKEKKKYKRRASDGRRKVKVETKAMSGTGRKKEG